VETIVAFARHEADEHVASDHPLQSHPFAQRHIFKNTTCCARDGRPRAITAPPAQPRTFFGVLTFLRRVVLSGGARVAAVLRHAKKNHYILYFPSQHQWPTYSLSSSDIMGVG